MPELGILDGLEGALRPPARLSLSEWADRYFVLSAESAAEPGRWRTLPYQRGVMDAITDPDVERISMMKSARVGFTKVIDAAIGYFMHQDPCPIMVVQPTVEDANGFSKEEIAPMLRDCDVLRELVGEQKTRISENTITHKTFPGGSLTMVGANSGRGFRRVSRRVVMFDEVDGYPASAGSEGDQIKLGIRRTEYYHNRKIIAGSTPLVAGASRIEKMFEAGDQRRYHIPCPSCGHRAPFAFREKADRSVHFMAWDDGAPETAHMVCGENGCIVEESHKIAMLEGGEWVAAAEFTNHASFHIWAGYSLSPNATWPQIAAEFLEAVDHGAEALKTFVNTVLGETWQERGEAPDYARLYERRERYPIGEAPAGVDFLTLGVDVQQDRLVYEVVGWQIGTKRSWSVDAGLLWGDTADDQTWEQLDELVGRTFPRAGGDALPIAMAAIDSGYRTQQVYGWCRRYPMSRVMACKGVATARSMVGTASPVDVTVRGKRLQRGYKVWPIGVALAKSELYGWLRLEAPADGDPYPSGWCAFPEYDMEYFRQITAEHLVEVKKRTGFVIREWQMIPNRENHWLDCRVYARAAAAVLGLDRARPPGKKRDKKPKPDGSGGKSGKKPGSWLQGSRPRGRGRGKWLKR